MRGIFFFSNVFRKLYYHLRTHIRKEIALKTLLGVRGNAFEL
jgi:hypothetical protein